MTQEDKDLLMKGLCARLPYGAKCRQHKLDSQVCTMRPEYKDVEEYEPHLRPIDGQRLMFRIKNPESYDWLLDYLWWAN